MNCWKHLVIYDGTLFPMCNKDYSPSGSTSKGSNWPLDVDGWSWLFESVASITYLSFSQKILLLLKNIQPGILRFWRFLMLPHIFQNSVYSANSISLCEFCGNPRAVSHSHKILVLPTLYICSNMTYHVTFTFTFTFT